MSMLDASVNYALEQIPFVGDALSQVNKWSVEHYQGNLWRLVQDAYGEFADDEVCDPDEEDCE